MTINESLKMLAVKSKLALEASEINNENNLEEIFFPFIEEVLGYDAIVVGDIRIAPTYNSDGTYKLEYGLSGDAESSYKTCVKVVGLGTDFSAHKTPIKEALINSATITQFVIITDCINYQVFVYDTISGMLRDIGEFTLVDGIENEMFQMLRSPTSTKVRQEYAVRDDEPNDLEEELERTISIPRKIEITEAPEKKKSPMIFFVILAIIVGLILLGIIAWFFTSSSSPLGFNGNQDKIDKGQLGGTLTVNSAGATFVSENIPDGAVIKLDTICGNNVSTSYGTLANRTMSSNLSINGTCEDASVIAYLRFDEAHRPQPEQIKKQFGEIGEKIIGKENAPDKFAITHVSFNVKQLTGGGSGNGGINFGGSNGNGGTNTDIGAGNKQVADFAEVEVRVDSVGNIKVLPKDFDMNKTNITESRNIYPQIFYSVAEKQSMMYLVCGTINQMQLIRFTDVLFYADGYTWSYQVSSNPKEIDITGGIAKEWVYFNDINSPGLLDNMSLLGKSEMSTVTFKGDKIKEHQLTQKEKNYITQLLYFYSEYFGNGASAPDVAWFETSKTVTGGSASGGTANSGSGITVNSGTSGTTGNSGGSGGSGTGGTASGSNNPAPVVAQKAQRKLQEPSVILGRSRWDENDIAKLYASIEKRRNDGQALSPDDIYNMENSVKKFKNYQTLLNLHIDELLDIDGEVVTVTDFADYIKMYFRYSTSGTFEEGYIPYMIIEKGGKGFIPESSESNNKYIKFDVSNDYIDIMKRVDNNNQLSTYE